MAQRGDLLDEHLAAWAALRRAPPASFDGQHYCFRDVYFEPKAFRKTGRALWLGGAGMHRRMTERIGRVSAFEVPAAAAPGSAA